MCLQTTKSENTHKNKRYMQIAKLSCSVFLKIFFLMRSVSHVQFHYFSQNITNKFLMLAVYNS